MHWAVDNKADISGGEQRGRRGGRWTRRWTQDCICLLSTPALTVPCLVWHTGIVQALPHWEHQHRLHLASPACQCQVCLSIMGMLAPIKWLPHQALRSPLCLHLVRYTCFQLSLAFQGGRGCRRMLSPEEEEEGGGRWRPRRRRIQDNAGTKYDEDGGQPLVLMGRKMLATMRRRRPMTTTRRSQMVMMTRTTRGGQLQCQ